jgi:mRNA interferase RelE/StbE
MSYELLQLPTAKRQLRQLSKSHNPFLKQIISRIEALRAEPRPPRAEKLAARPEWRIRIADYRVLYLVDDEEKTVTISSVAHRREIYK